MICPPEHRHGLTLTCYTAHACRCPECRHTHADYLRQGRAIQGANVYVSATGARRRLQALAIIGYSTPRIGAATGLGQNILHYIRNGTQKRCTAATAKRIAHVYRDIMTEPAPRTRHTRAIIARAHRAGWRGPMYWDDIDTQETPA